MESLPIIYIFVIFILAGLITWFAGITLAKSTDSLDFRFKIGDAIGGLVLLGIAGSLPEIAVVSTAAKHGDIEVIIGNLIGGLSIQTLVIIIFDFVSHGKKPLSYLAGTAILSFETLLAVLVAVIALLAIFVPEKASVFHINPLSVLIVAAWLIGLYFINKSRNNPKFNLTAVDAEPGRRHHERYSVENHKFYRGKSNLIVILVFLFAAGLTLVAGVYLEKSGTMIANHFGISSGLFAATALAFVTTLPELSTGLESIFIGDNQLAISDIIGGNAFMLILFLMTDLIAKKPILSHGGRSDMIFAVIAILMMSVYAISFVRRSKKRIFRLGLDSILVLIIYITGLFVLAYWK